MDRGTWQAIVHRVTESGTTEQLSSSSSRTSITFCNEITSLALQNYVQVVFKFLTSSLEELELLFVGVGGVPRREG